MTAASSAETALCRQSLPSLHPCGAVIRAQRASNGQLDDLWAVSALHRCMVPDDSTRDQSVRCRPAPGRPERPGRGLPRGSVAVSLPLIERRRQPAASHQRQPRGRRWLARSRKAQSASSRRPARTAARC
jgi:hypothetical protein